jgi:hypothetical protein
MIRTLKCRAAEDTRAIYQGTGIIRGDWKGELGPGEKTLIEGFKGLSPFGPASLKVA